MLVEKIYFTGRLKTDFTKNEYESFRSISQSNCFTYLVRQTLIIHNQLFSLLQNAEQQKYNFKSTYKILEISQLKTQLLSVNASVCHPTSIQVRLEMQHSFFLPPEIGLIPGLSTPDFTSAAAAINHVSQNLKFYALK